MKEMHEFEEKYMQNEAFWEFEALSIFLGVNPFEYAYQYINVDYDEAAPDTNVTIVGIIANVQKKKDRTGKQFAFLNMYSVFGLMEVVCWHTQFKQNEDIISRGAQVAMLCKKGGDEKLTAVKAIKPYTQWLKDRKISDIQCRKGVASISERLKFTIVPQIQRYYGNDFGVYVFSTTDDIPKFDEREVSPFDDEEATQKTKWSILAGNMQQLTVGQEYDVEAELVFNKKYKS